VLAGALLALSLGACSSEPTFDRAAAVDEVVRDSGGQLSQGQAECYVDRVVGELGTNALGPAGRTRPEYLPQLTRIRVDCTGIASLGTAAPTTATTADANLGSRPMRQGDDPELDALANNCTVTGGAPCDELFDRSAPGSAYEELASTCGGRTKEASCAATYGAGGASTSTSTSSAVPAAPVPTTVAVAPTTRRTTTTTRR